MARLVIGDDLAFFRRNDLVLLLQAGDHAVDRLLEVLHLDGFLALPGRQQGRLVADVGDFGAGEAGRLAGQHLQVHVVAQDQVARVHLEDLQPLAAVGLVDENLSVEAAGPQQGRIEHVGPVRGRHDDDALVRVETVHFDEQLVQRVFALVVGAHHDAAATGATDRVDLVDEDDAGRFLLGLPEQIAHARGPHAHEHLDEVAPRNGKERHARLTGHRLGQQRFARTRRPHQQHAFGQLAAQSGELLRVLQKLDDFRDFFFGLVQPGHVLERDPVVAHRIVENGPVLSDIEHLRAGVHAAQQKHPERHNENERKDPGEQSPEPVLLNAGGELYGRTPLGAGLFVVGQQEAGQIVIGRFGGRKAADQFGRLCAAKQVGLAHRYRHQALAYGGLREAPLHLRVVDNLDALHVAFFDVFEKLAVFDRAGVGTRPEQEKVHQQRQENRQINPDGKTRPPLRQAGAVGRRIFPFQLQAVALVLRHGISATRSSSGSLQGGAEVAPHSRAKPPRKGISSCFQGPWAPAARAVPHPAAPDGAAGWQRGLLLRYDSGPG